MAFFFSPGTSISRRLVCRVVEDIDLTKERASCREHRFSCPAVHLDRPYTESATRARSNARASADITVKQRAMMVLVVLP